MPTYEEEAAMRRADLAGLRQREEQWLPFLERMYAQKAEEDRSWRMFEWERDFIGDIAKERDRQRMAGQREMKLETLQGTQAMERIKATGAEQERVGLAGIESERKRIGEAWGPLAGTLGLPIPTSEQEIPAWAALAKERTSQIDQRQVQPQVDEMLKRVNRPDLVGLPLDMVTDIISTEEKGQGLKEKAVEPKVVEVGGRSYVWAQGEKGPVLVPAPVWKRPTPAGTGAAPPAPEVPQPTAEQQKAIIKAASTIEEELAKTADANTVKGLTGKTLKEWNALTDDAREDIILKRAWKKYVFERNLERKIDELSAGKEAGEEAPTGEKIGELTTKQLEEFKELATRGSKKAQAVLQSLGETW